MGGEKLKMNKELIEKIEELFETTIKDKCEISIKKDKNGNADTHVEGSGLNILFTLAGLEKGVLEELGCDENTFNFIKNLVGTKRVENE